MSPPVAFRPAPEALACSESLELTLAPCRAPVTPVDRAASRRLAALVGAADRDCYQNSVRALLHGGAETDGALYVEGIVVVEYGAGLFVEHGWLERPDGVVLDPTPVHCAEAAESRAYFPIRRMSRHEVLARGAEAGPLTLPFLDCPLGFGRSLPEWLVAQLAAWRHFSALHLTRHGRAFFSSEAAAELVAALVSTHTASAATS